MPLIEYGFAPPIELAAVRATAPVTVPAVVLELMISPLPPKPVPERLKGLATVVPFKSNAPPLTVIVPEPKGPLIGGPDAVFTPDCKVPPVMDVPPV